MLYEHAINRAKERYGLDLTNGDLREIVSRIEQNRDVVFVCHYRKRHDVYNLEYHNTNIVVGYKTDDNRITTFLPIESLYSKQFNNHQRKYLENVKLNEDNHNLFDTMYNNLAPSMLELYGVEITDEDIEYINKDIRACHNCVRIHTISQIQRVMLVERYKMLFACVYHKKYKSIIEILPKEDIAKYIY